MLKYFIFLWMLVLVSCYTRKEGCLDTLAANFDVTSDDECTTCCTYPKLILNIDKSAKIGSSDTTLINQFSQKYIIKDVRFYVSEFALYQNQEQIKINEVIGTANNAYINKNDMKILRSVDGSIDIGTVKTYGKFDSLIFYLGLTENVLNNTFVNLPTNHVLSPASKLSDVDGQTALMTIRYQYKSTTQKDSIFNFTILHKNIDNNKYKYVVKDSLNLKYPQKTSRKGENIEAKITADYKMLLDNVNLETSKDSISKKIEQNIKSILRVN